MRIIVYISFYIYGIYRRYNASAGGESSGITIGIDPIGPELQSSYGDNRVRVMHWLLDADNIFGFGNIQVRIRHL